MESLDTSRLCIDTAALIAYLRSREPGASAVERAIKECVCHVTAVTVYELFFGLARIGWPMGENELVEVMTVLPFNDAAAKRAAQLHDQLIRQNNDIGVKDVYIASICLENNLPLLTPNQRHFSRVPGLGVITPEDFASTPR